MYLAGLNLREKSVLIVGGGSVANRKSRALLAAGARLTLISPDVSETLAGLVAEGLLAWERTTYSADFLYQIRPVLVFAATDDATLNAQITTDARQYGAWANNASDSTDSDFHTLATVDRNPIQIGISSGGAAPALLANLRHEIETIIGKEWGTLATWLGEIRTLAKTQLVEQSERAALYERLLQSEIRALLRSGDETSARQQFDAIVANALAQKEPS